MGCLQNMVEKDNINKSIENVSSLETATFAGGCFWCMEAVFQELDGVYSVVSGYTGGNVSNPTYEDVGTGKTGHYEAVEIKYDSSVITFQELLDIFWKNIDPTDPIGQFTDKGSQYKTAIFYHNESQKQLAEKSKQDLIESKKFDKEVVTEILPAKEFYEAEDYHQDYYINSRLNYNLYKKGSGRERKLKNLWEK
jgi:peptide methionine sulfoxide reductase msrA/msrB